MSSDYLKLLSQEIIQFYEKLHSWEHAVAKSTGLSPQQNHTIEIIGNEGSIRMKPLSKKLGVTTGTLTVMIDRLEKAGFVSRKKDTNDGRAFNVVLTDQGNAIHLEHHAYHLKLAEDIKEHLPNEESDIFLKLISKINTFL